MPTWPKRKRYGRATRRVKRRVAVSRRMPRIPALVSFKRTVILSPGWTWNTTTVAGFYRRITPALNLLPNFNEYQALFDEYRMNAIKITFHPRFQGTQSDTFAGAPSQNQFYMTTSIDKRSDPQFVPSGLYSSTTYNQMLEYQDKVKTFQCSKPFSVFIKKPTIQATVSTGNTKMKNPGWLSILDAGDMNWNSLWCFFHDYNFLGNNNASFGVDIQYTFYFQCRGYA